MMTQLSRQAKLVGVGALRDVKQTCRRVVQRWVNARGVGRPAAAAHLWLRKRQTGIFNTSRQAEWGQRAEAAVDLWMAAGDAVGADGGRLRVADFGAGNERLRGILASKLTTAHDYFPYDLHPQKPSTQPLDVLQTLPGDRFDLVFCLGLIEYIPLDNRFLQRLSESCRFAILSYVVTDSSLRLTERQREAAGWRSHLSAEQFGSLLEASNFRPVSMRRTDGDQTGLWLAESRQVAGSSSSSVAIAT
jgi:hypothetical protein